MFVLLQDDNDDYCASCSGSGDLVCCDGCTRSFHFNCVDPPVHEDRDLPDEWFCNVCIARRNPASLTRYTGVFGALLNIMEQRNSSAFSLPSETRNYFEGVKTGTEGEYEDIVVTGTSRTRFVESPHLAPGIGPKSLPTCIFCSILSCDSHQSFRKRNYDEAPDFFRIRDNDGNPVLCHICNSSAQDNRPIIPCAYCGLWWHIDCLDPPMANPPVLRNWRCPAHTDDILAKLPGQLGPAHRFRKIKGAPVVKPSYSRGMINNGFIEFTSDDDSSDSQSGWKHVQTFGRMQRIGARGVELDFLEQIRREQNTGKQRRARMHRYQERPEFRNDDIEVVPKAEPAAEPNRVLLTDRHRIDEAQAAQNLSALYTSEERTDRSGELINALLSQADASVISMMAQGSPLNIEIGSALTQEDLAALQAMRARIDLLLSNPRTRPESHQVNDLKAREAGADEAQDVPEVAMEDAQVAGEGLPEPGSEQIVPETNEVMSLVSDNGENEDEDPPTITTPLNASEDEPGSAVWPVEHSVSDPGSGNGTLPASAKAELSENDIDGFRLCDHNNAKRPPAAGDSVPAPILEKTLETVAISNTADGDKEKEDKEDKEDKQGEGQQGADATTNGTSSPPTPVPASSETAVGDEDNKENEKMADRLDKQSEQVDGGLESTEARTETNDAADT
ncbi:uncharacterized protein SPSK_07205 [Sporothrix schenckii 1099-18]|uniref:PHD-type domain-containing protein n=1 Tax=Sporothrix schenckii 1099-18 TaxID=1397361 RepID=A0A0F2MDQ1_SPOSC|nr:uncharacterized protein SPSK_07205 [Sporothrix schenckii 1099-18]KJR87818.1 hypothetical protein SPSK_07205 [Sporothrix schenckii 1099-18]